MPLRLLVESDLEAVRSLLLSSMDPATALTSLPDNVIAMDAVGGRAEALVLERLGTDGLAFMTPGAILPAYYAQGDAVLARQLVHDALVQFCCAQLLVGGFLQQLIPTVEQTADQRITLDLKWEDRKQAFMAAGYEALYLLRRPIPVEGRRFASPSGGASGRMEAHLRVGPHRRPWCRDERWRD